MSDAWLTVPVSRYSERVLASTPIDDAPARDTYWSLTDPTNYAHVLDFKEARR